MTDETEVPAVHSPAPSQTLSTSTLVNMEDGETQPSGSRTQSSGSGSKCKQGRIEAIGKMITIQKSNDQMMMSLEEKRMKMEERQMELCNDNIVCRCTH